MIMLERCDLAHLIVEMMVNIIVLVLWRYLEYLWWNVQFSSQQNHLMQFRYMSHMRKQIETNYQAIE